MTEDLLPFCVSITEAETLIYTARVSCFRLILICIRALTASEANTQPSQPLCMVSRCCLWFSRLKCIGERSTRDSWSFAAIVW